jgi:type IV pilus assembly protein PilA
MKRNHGFTLLEILLVVGIIAILAGIVIVALNPTKQFSQVRNTQRKANLSELNKALYQYYIDHSHYPTSLTTTLTEICATGATSTGHSLNCTNRTDLSYLVPTYLVAIPTDPQATGTSTGYLVAKNTANKVYLKADNAELSQTTTIGDTSGVLPDHLVSYWSFDGNALDSVGGNNGTVMNGAVATTGVRGLINTAYYFDGVDDYVSVDDSPSQTVYNFSVITWIKRTGAVGHILTKGGDTTNWEYVMLFSGTAPYVNIWGNSGSCDEFSASSNISPAVGEWSQVAFVYRLNESLTIYVNGTQTGFDNTKTAGCNFSSGSSKLNIGRRSDSSKFNGAIDNVRIYNSALSADDIMLIYNFEKP